jgi:hypothetical protein
MPAIDIHSPLRDAVSQMASRRVTPSGMTSREWEAIQAEIRLRCMFSSRVESERVLVEMKERLNAGISNEKTGGATMDRSRFVEEMRGIIRETGYRRPDGVNKKSVRNLKSRARLELIWNMNVAQAAGYAQWKSHMDPDMLFASPCYELVRLMPKREIRDWPLVWEDHGGKFYGEPGKDYPYAKGRMIAQKTDPIWRWISRFKTPWPPFDWGSGMGLRNVRRAEALALGVIKDDADPQVPLAVPFNADHRMSLKDVPESGRERLRSDFGDTIRIDNDEIKLQRETSPETDEQRKQDISQSLRERARDYYLQTRDLYAREIQRTNPGTDLGDGGEGTRDVTAIYLAQAASVAVGRKRLFHDTMPPAETAAFFKACSEVLPAEVAIDVAEGTGDILIWRRDLLTIDPKQVVADMRDGRGGLLMGYGLDSPAWAVPVPHVAVRIYRSPRQKGDEMIGGFDAPLQGWEAFAKARARDFEDAWGIPMELEWEVNP